MTHSSKTPSKQDLLLALLSRPEGATLGQIMDATGWQKHSVRGFISGFIKKKKGLSVISEKPKSGERMYKIQAAVTEAA
jgi:hypothetical protein